jgi:hypothetical protein
MVGGGGKRENAKKAASKFVWEGLAFLARPTPKARDAGHWVIGSGAT